MGIRNLLLPKTQQLALVPHNPSWGFVTIYSDVISYSDIGLITPHGDS